MKEIWSKEQERLLKECVKYFREYPIFSRLLGGFREKYFSYGRFSGTVVLKIKNEEEIDQLEGFFQCNFHGKKTVSITAGKFEKALFSTKFSAISPQMLLEEYFSEELLSKKEQKRKKEERWNRTFEAILQENEKKPAREWLVEMKETLKQKSREACFLQLAAQILNLMPFRRGEVEYLAVFAAFCTGNPHSFDERSEGGQLLNSLILWEIKKQEIDLEDEGIFPMLRKQKMYLEMGILLDDISNYAILSGVRAWKDKKVHAGMEGFRMEGDSVLVPVSVIHRWESVECPENEIYIVENPSIYAMLSRKWKGKKACMCMNGQPRLSAVLVLDLLAKAKVHVYYAGDFDPEGLLIAQKLRQYYKGAFSYWHMSVIDYQKSEPSVEMNEKRMKILDRIVDEELLESAQEIKNRKFAGYQENIWKEYE